jgi:segregation and condensation protein B
MRNDLKNIIESLLFISDNPVDIRALKQVMPDTDAKDIRLAIAELMGEYEERQGGFLLYEVAGGFQFRTRPEYKDWIKKLVKPVPVRLSRASLETLAIIAYHQPIIRSDVEKIRGVDSGAIIRSLLERKLIRILGKKEIPARPMIYATTRRFLEIFNLKSLSDMPSLKEIQEFGKDGAGAYIVDGSMEQPVPAEDGSSSEPDTTTPAGDDSVFTAPAPETRGTEESLSPEQAADLSETAAESDVPDEEGIESGAEEPAADEETDMPEQDMGNPEYDEPVSPADDDPEFPDQVMDDMPEEETGEPEAGSTVFPDQGVSTPESDETEEDPPIPEDEGGM